MSVRLLPAALTVLVVAACGPGRSADPLDRLAHELLGRSASAQLVCLGETHGSRLDAELRRAIVRHPDFTDLFDVVVVEFASPRHQERLDRFVLHGEAATRDELRPIWLDAGLGRTWELPIYESFLRAVAEVNRERPAEKRVRVVGAAVAVDWAAVETPSDLAALPNRLDQFEEVLRREVVDAGKRGLAIFATGHCERRSPAMLARLASANPDRVWTAFGVDGPGGRRAARERLGLDHGPTLVAIRGSDLGEAPSGEILFEGHAAAGASLGELADALVWYGDRADEVFDPYALELDPALAAELDRRDELWAAARAIQ